MIGAAMLLCVVDQANSHCGPVPGRVDCPCDAAHRQVPDLRWQIKKSACPGHETGPRTTFTPPEINFALADRACHAINNHNISLGGGARKKCSARLNLMLWLDKYRGIRDTRAGPNRTPPV